ncbi:MAG: hypothetical protein PHE53_02945 [Thermoguttaceae bacterium]|nr:hypothetical protein [Thermoguttaceae bacterium]
MELFESNLDVIATAADRQMLLLRTFQTGKHSADSQRLLNEVAAARVCLLNPVKRDAYDQQLLDTMQHVPADIESIDRSIESGDTSARIAPQTISATVSQPVSSTSATPPPLIIPPSTLPSETVKTPQSIYEQIIQPPKPAVPTTLDQVLKSASTSTSYQPAPRVAWIRLIVILISLLCIAVSIWYGLHTLKILP